MEIIESKDSSERTPPESRLLSDWLEGLGRGEQYQAWHRGKMVGIFWGLEEVYHEITEHINEYGNYKEFRLSYFYGSQDSWNLEIQSPADKRWMSSPTFILRVNLL